ncbi:MAG TPA: EAL domain-containing protein [Thermoanaerobaculia bacterium]|nr:EAL domain-containing protein [Thermoanaerobaculia bacterium]
MTAQAILRFPTLDEILESGHLRPLFQPIVRLVDPARPFGFEALTRYRTDNPLIDPEFLFLYAGRKDRVCDLDNACLRRSLEHGGNLARSNHLFINIHPAMLLDVSRWIGALEQAAAGGGLPLDRVVLEVTEQGALDIPRLGMSAFDRLRALGLRFALDDVGVAYSHLASIDRIGPSFIKIGQHFGTDFERDASRLKIVRNILSLATDLGCEVVLEGIETAETLDAARQLGIELGQGYFFAHPGEASSFAA